MMPVTEHTMISSIRYGNHRMPSSLRSRSSMCQTQNRSISMP